MRLDKYILEQGYAPSRARAQDLIQQGCISISGKVIMKASYDVKEGDEVSVALPEESFASRAGFKLFDVLEPFEIDLKDRIAIDVGASTGGFSDVCLKQGAKLVYAVDVGCDQLLERLKKDPRIVNMEHTNCRYLEKTMFDQPIDFACMDVSFISAKLILPALFSVMEQVEAVILIKPQFEAGKQALNKHGVVKDKKEHIKVLKDMVSFVEAQGYYVKHLQPSSIVGRDGNHEYVMHVVSQPCHNVFHYEKLVNEANSYVRR